MKTLAVLFVLCLLLSSVAAADSCVSAAPSSLVGTSCTIGDMLYTFTGYSVSGDIAAPSDLMFVPDASDPLRPTFLLQGSFAGSSPDGTISTVHVGLTFTAATAGNIYWISQLPDPLSASLNVPECCALHARADSLFYAFGGGPINTQIDQIYNAQGYGYAFNHGSALYDMPPSADSYGVDLLLEVQGTSATWEGAAFTLNEVPVPEPSAAFLVLSVFPIAKRFMGSRSRQRPNMSPSA